MTKGLVESEPFWLHRKELLNLVYCELVWLADVGRQSQRPHKEAGREFVQALSSAFLPSLFFVEQQIKTFLLQLS